MNSRTNSKRSVDESKHIRGLKQIIPADSIVRALGENLSTRYCKQITNSQLVWVIVGFGLFSGKSYRDLYRLIVRRASDKLPTRATICTARKRISAAVLERVHNTVVSMLAVSPRKHSWAFYKGMQLVGTDGTLMDCYDSDANREAFGRTSNQTSYGAFPKARVVSLCELGTRVLYRSVIGTYHDSEQTLVRQLFEFLHAKTLLLADRHFGVAPILIDLIERGVPYLIRAKKSHVYVIEKRLSDGSFLSKVYPGKNDRRLRRPGKTVRVIKYTLNDPNRCGYGEVHVLLTSLLDEKKHPASELICLYHERWEEEIAFAEMKVSLHDGKVLRSQSPEMIRQEIWGLLLSHFIVRKLIFEASLEAGVPPKRISFTGAINVLEVSLASAPASPRRIRKWLRAIISEIAFEMLPPRQNRINPRLVKKRSTSVKTKHDHHRKPPPPHPTFADIIQISI